MALWKPSDLIRFTLCPQRINTYTCHLHKDHAICRKSATQSRTEVDPVAVRQHTKPMASSTHRLQQLTSWSTKWDRMRCGHLTSLGAVEAALPTCTTLRCPSFLLSRGYSLLAQHAHSLNARQAKSAGLVKTSPWEGAVASSASTAGSGGSYSPHGCRCMGLVLTFSAEGNTTQMTDLLGHAHETPHTARLVSLKHLFP